MAAKGEFYHSLAVDAYACLGCAHCIRRCPTKALRIRNGVASLRKDWCVDCGECLKVCPVSAIYVEQDDFDSIFGYECRVALVPAVFLGQFSETDSEERIFDAIRALGFTHIYPVELTAGFVREQMVAEMAGNKTRPLISAFCPAVVRLIQTKFPDLLGNVLNIRAPAETTAQLVRHRLEAAGNAPSQIGIFYVTPCAAKAAAIHEGGGRLINGILNLNSLYNKVCHQLCNEKRHSVEILPGPGLSREAMGWSMTGGEASGFTGRCFAVDGIHHVAEFLERLETTGEIYQTDFLELRACNRSCMGGALTPANRFLAEERLRKRMENHPSDPVSPLRPDEAEFLAACIRIEKPVPMNKLVYQGGIEQVLQQMNAAQRIERSLPGIDCGACGSPTCRSLANDIVRGEAMPGNCIFRQLLAVGEGRVDVEDIRHRLEEVWGRERFIRKTE